jgi:hypothetical protein
LRRQGRQTARQRISFDSELSRPKHFDGRARFHVYLLN